MGDLWRRREELEASAATLLGRFTFAFSRLERNVELAVESLRRNGQLVASQKAHRRDGFFEELDAMLTSVRAIDAINAKGKRAYSTWGRKAHSLRDQRNALIHGGWDVDPERDLVLNIRRQPRSKSITVEYTLSKLETLASSPTALHAELSKLRLQWPL